MSTIVLDPGHGGHTSAGKSTPFGGRGAHGYEKELTLDLAHRTAGRLGGGAILTRRDDRNLTLAQRQQVVRRSAADVFVSLHFNNGSPHARGPAVWVHEQAGTDSLALAHSVAQSLGYGSGPAPVRSADLAVLSPRGLPGHNAACMVEADCLSNPDVEQWLRFGGGIDELSARIAEGIDRHVTDHRHGRGGGYRAYGAVQAPATMANLIATRGTEIRELPEQPAALDLLRDLASRTKVLQALVGLSNERTAAQVNAGDAAGAAHLKRSNWSAAEGTNFRTFKHAKPNAFYVHLFEKIADDVVTRIFTATSQFANTNQLQPDDPVLLQIPLTHNEMFNRRGLFHAHFTYETATKELYLLFHVFEYPHDVDDDKSTKAGQVSRDVNITGRQYNKKFTHARGDIYTTTDWHNFLYSHKQHKLWLLDPRGANNNVAYFTNDLPGTTHLGGLNYYPNEVGTDNATYNPKTQVLIQHIDVG